MRRFKYYDQDGEYIVNERWIIDNYYYHWKAKMQRLGRDKQISKENCIDDFCVINWAEEIEDD